MKAVRIHEHGGADVLRYEDVDAPELLPGHVRVAVRALGVNRGDITHREGHFPTPPPMPYALGFEFAGDVLEIADDVTGFSIGDRVCGHSGHGAYAEQIVLVAGELARLPDDADYVEAAALPVGFCTAWWSLVKFGRIEPGETVLVHSGGSAVGTACMSLGRHLGARVLVTVGSEWKGERCLELGAEAAINYSTHDFVEEVMRLTAGDGVRLVVEHIGGDVFARSLLALRRPGRLVAVGSTSGEPSTFPSILLLAKEAEVYGLYLDMCQQRGETGPVLRELADLYGAGKIKPVIDRVMGLADAGEAQRVIEERKNFGKVVLQP
jgi:NADPH:quinone reductase-like Zn-dependent oxidoreductase